MIYKNTKTGAVIETTAAVSGGNWQEMLPVSPPVPAQEKAVQPKKAKRRPVK